MSSDAYYVTTLEVTSDEVLLEVQGTGAGGLTDLAYTRSFFLMVLDEVARLGLGEALLDQDNVEPCIDQYIVSTKVEGIVGLQDEAEIRRYIESWGLEPSAVMPRATVRVKCATEAYAAALGGLNRHGTTSWDVWWTDPKRPTKLPKATAPEPLYPLPKTLLEDTAKALLARLPDYRASGKRKLALAGPDATLNLEVMARKAKLGSDVYLNAVVSTDKLSGKALEVLRGVIQVTPTAHAGLSAGEIAARLSEVLLKQDVAATLTLPGLIEVLEQDGAERLYNAKIKKAFKSFAKGPALPEGFDLHAGIDEIFWLRPLALKAAGRPEEAKEAFAQVSAAWKKRPTELAPALAALEAELGLTP